MVDKGELGMTWNLYPKWHKEIKDELRKKRNKVLKSWSLLKNRNTAYADSMSRMIYLFDNLLVQCEKLKPSNETDETKEK